MTHRKPEQHRKPGVTLVIACLLAGFVPQGWAASARTGSSTATGTHAAAMPSSSASTSASTADAPVAVIKLVPYRKSVGVHVVVNGKPGFFTFDTAGGHSIVSPGYAKTIGCTPWGLMVGYQMTGNRLSMQRCDDLSITADGYGLHVPVAGVLDVAPLAAKDAEPVDGLLALDAFAGQTISMDFAGGELVVESPASAERRIANARELPVRLLREAGGMALAVTLEVPTSRGTVRFEIDSGNGGTILVSKPYASLFGLDPDAPGPQRGSFTIAPGIQASGVMFTPELTIDGNLGMPFLKDWVVTVDLAEGRMWIQRSQATPPAGMGTPPPLPAEANDASK